jgi:transposase InsO family protein
MFETMELSWKKKQNVVQVGKKGKLYSTLWGDARRNPPAAMSVWVRLQLASLQIPMTRDERKRLQWFIAYNTTFKGNARKTCRYFGISPKTFYYWRKRFDITNPRCLRERSHRPKYSPPRKINVDQTEKIASLRMQHPHYSKLKIAVLYQRLYREKVSSWQVQRVIEDYKLYPDLKKARRAAWRRGHSTKKERIANCPRKPWTGWLISFDSIVLHVMSRKRYILTAIDHHSRLMLAKTYATHSSRATADFLEQVVDFFDNRVQNIHSDNGSEFHDSFERTAKRLQLAHWWSRTHTPKDNAINERVNRTLKEEFLPEFRQCEDLEVFNAGLAVWVNEYNHERPHGALEFKTPFEVAMASPNPLPRVLDWEMA